MIATTACDKDEPPNMLNNTTWVGTDGAGNPIKLLFSLLSPNQVLYIVDVANPVPLKYTYVRSESLVNIDTYGRESFLSGTFDGRRK